MKQIDFRNVTVSRIISTPSANGTEWKWQLAILVGVVFMIIVGFKYMFEQRKKSPPEQQPRNYF